MQILANFYRQTGNKFCTLDTNGEQNIQKLFIWADQMWNVLCSAVLLTRLDSICVLWPCTARSYTCYFVSAEVMTVYDWYSDDSTHALRRLRVSVMFQFWFSPHANPTLHRKNNWTNTIHGMISNICLNTEFEFIFLSDEMWMVFFPSELNQSPTPVYNNIGWIKSLPL